MKYRTIVLAVLIGAGGASNAGGALPPIETTTLKNGLRVVLAPDPDARAADVTVWYATGSRLEKPGQSGITHLFDRLMFHGTEASGSGDYRRLLYAEGAIANTLTTPDYTSFFATVPSGAVELALRLEAERMARLRITAADFEAERALALSERRMSLEANPVTRGVQQLFATAFPGHGYGRPLLGLEADLTSITLDDAIEYYRDRYAPGNAVITVVGRFEVSTTLAAIRRYFEPLPRRGTSTPRVMPPPPPRPRSTDRIPGRTPLLMAGWRAPASSDPASAALALFSRVFSSSSTGPLGGSRLTQSRAGFDARRDGSLFYVVAMVRSPADSATAEQELLEAIERLASAPVAPEDFDRAKRALELEWLLDQQTVRGRARVLGEALLVDGDARTAARRLDVIRNLTPEDLMAVAQKVFRPAGRSVVWMIPTGSGTPAPGEEGGVR